MSQQLWTTETSQNDASSEPQVDVRDETTKHRLTDMRETLVRLLGELNALSLSQPVDISCGARLHDEVRRFETDLIRSALHVTRGRQTKAAQLLGIKLTTLNAKIKRYHIIPALFGAEVQSEIDERKSVA